MAVGNLTEQNINIARGLVRGASVIHKFGRNPNVGGAPETIWEQGGVYTYLTVASTVYVSGADAQDSAAGTGARTVTVQGLDANYNAIEATKALKTLKNDLVETTPSTVSVSSIAL